MTWNRRNHEEAHVHSNTREIRLLNEEISRVFVEKRDLEQRIRELARERTCPPHKFEAGQIRSEQEMAMPCIFCGAVGVHYSDVCEVNRDIRQRWRIVRETERCRLCLRRRCMGGVRCDKKKTRCRHCGELGHHPSLCFLPQRSEETQEELQALERLQQNVQQLNLLRRRLFLLKNE
ncbi:hypothetical protein RB195_012961 [Necator americanus]|uniref:Zinc knuckle n=1 Tax=Necator americanus TaxID=51031 RepID=A0ABR1DTG5_NECAM